MWRFRRRRGNRDPERRGEGNPPPSKGIHGFWNDSTYLELFDRALHDAPDDYHRPRFWTMIQFLRSTLDLPGETGEAGCALGLSSYLICSYRRLYDPSFTGAGHHVFDSFRGFRGVQTVDVGPYSNYRIRKLLQEGPREKQSFRATTEQTLAEFPEISFHEGWIPEVFEELPDARFKFAHIDVDLYEPTQASLEYFYPRLVSGGLIVVDDYGFMAWPGAKTATDRWSARNGVPVVLLPTGNALLIKRHQ
jgi:hypothetical protein